NADEGGSACEKQCGPCAGASGGRTDRCRVTTSREPVTDTSLRVHEVAVPRVDGAYTGVRNTVSAIAPFCCAGPPANKRREFNRKLVGATKGAWPNTCHKEAA